MSKTYAEINEKIRAGKAVVVTAEEMIGIVDEDGASKAAERVDVVTTGTFGAMCSSGAMLNVGHPTPRMRMTKVWLNEVPAYAGLAAVDCFIGATELPENDPRNREHPGLFPYGGAHVIHELIAGDDVRMVAEAYPTDGYPRKKLDSWLNIKDLNQAYLLNPRNAYQNYGVAVNLREDRDIYTYMGVVQSNLGSASFCSAGQLSPLLNDPFYRTIGIGTRVFLGGGVGHVYYEGTQHNPTAPRSENGVPTEGAGTIGVCGDMKQMKPEWIVGVSMYGYGVSMCVGLGLPIPILNEDMARYTAVKDEDILAPVLDYSHAYPYREGGPLGHVNYAQLKSGEIEVNGKKVPTVPLSSYVKAQEIAETLKDWIDTGNFLLAEPAQLIPSVESGQDFKSFNERPVTNGGVK